jgi:hypothetical protein
MSAPSIDQFERIMNRSHAEREEAMKRLLIILTVVNLVLLVFLLAQVPPTAGRDASVLRGRALEITDEQGRVRASIVVHPAEPSAATPYPETVMLRLIDPNGRPFVKIGGSEQGGGLGLLGDSDSTHVLVKAQGPDTSLKLTNQNGREHVIRP